MHIFLQVIGEIKFTNFIIIKILILKFRCVIEKNELGTGGCLSQLKNIVKNDFMVANGDSILLENLNFLFEKKIPIILFFLRKTISTNKI